MTSPLAPYIARHYAEVKQHHPGEGHRRWRLRIAQRFWTAVGDPNQRDVLPEVAPVVGSGADPDSLDEITRDVLGLIVRTDFSDELSWAAFCDRLQDSEKEFFSGSGDVDGHEDDSDSDSEDEDLFPTVFHIVNPPSPPERELLTDVSNLTVLRLFNGVDIRPSPTPPHGTQRIHPPNRLVDRHGWQECYRGKNVWIYDTKSNMDQCVRVVSQSGDMYGTATGDSWRARVSCICEIQVYLSSGAITIDFGGLDRWDVAERSRNMMEAEC